jgi:putative DNA primase/helicase
MNSRVITEKFYDFTTDRLCDRRFVSVVGKCPVRPGTIEPIEWRKGENRWSWEQIQKIPGDYGIILDGTGLTCLDFDKCLNENGSIIDDRIFDIVRDLGTWCEVSSSGRGLHAWIVTDANTRNQKPPGTGIEVITDGHVKVTGNSFPQYAHKPIQMIDGEELIKILRLNGSGSTSAHIGGSRISREKIREGGRNTTLFKLAASLRQKGLSEPAIRAAIIEENRELCDPPLPEAEINRISSSAGNYPIGTISTYIPPPQTQNGGYPEPLPIYTDGWHADVFKATHGENVRYCATTKQWYVWNGTYWRPDKTGEVPGLLRSVIHDQLLQAVIDGKDKNKIKFLTSSDSSRIIHSALYILESNMCTVLQDELDADVDRVTVKNGVMNLKTLKLEVPDKTRYLTKTMDVAYDAGATCPTWENHINLIFGDDAGTKISIQQILGYCLLHDNPEQLFFILHGSGENVKSVSISCLSAIMGDYCKNADPRTFMQTKNTDDKVRSDVARLFGAHMVSAVEGAQGQRLNESMVKAFAGCDKMTARMNYDKCEYDSFLHAKVLLGTNHEPVIKDTTHGMWRKVIKIPFVIPIPENVKDKNIMEKFTAEKSGILNWLLAGLKSYYENNGIKLSTAITDATQAYRKKSDDFTLFLEGYDFTGSEHDVLFKRDIWESYKKWYESEFGSLPKFTMRTLNQVLEEKKCVSKRKENGMVWLGIKNKSDGTSQVTITKNEEMKVNEGFTVNSSTRARIEEVTGNDTSTFISSGIGSDPVRNPVSNSVAQERLACINSCGRAKLDWCNHENILYPYCGVKRECPE